jgi:hypothetical protein
LPGHHEALLGRLGLDQWRLGFHSNVLFGRREDQLQVYPPRGVTSNWTMATRAGVNPVAVASAE